MTAAPTDPAATAGRPARAYARTVVFLRFPLLVGWAAVAVYAAVVLPAPAQPPDSLVSLVPASSAAVRADALALRLFRVPLTAQTAIVQRDPGGLSPAVTARVYVRAARADRAALRGDAPAGLVALPVVNRTGVVPGSRESGTTAITYLESPAGTSSAAGQAAVDRYRADIARHHDDLVGVTGIAPAQVHEGALVDRALPLIEVATVVLVALLVGVRFRSPGAPLLTLAAVGTAYTLAEQLVAHVARRAGFSQPSLLRPLLVALVLGIVTDYVVFYLSNARAKTLGGATRLEAATRATAETTPIVLAGGAILTAGLMALEVAQVRAFQELGPGLALAVAAAVAVAVTLVPAALAVFGRALFWPRLRTGEPWRPHPDAPRRNRTARLIAHRSAAVVVAAACVAGLGAAADRAAGIRLGVTNIAGLPADAQERVAAAAAGRGFAEGMLSPTQVIVARPGVVADGSGLRTLGRALRREPGVAAVIGPADAPFERGLGVLTTRAGGAARFLVVYRSDPYGATAIDQASALRAHVPALAAAAGLHGVRTAVAGDTVVAADTVSAVRTDLVRVVLAVLAINMLLLMLFLRALVAPLLLVAASALSVAAALGITSFTFQTLLGYHELTYYVPFAAGVLLVSLGSDYNVFVAGRVWQEARVRPLRDALRVAPARTTAAIRTAGITLATSFGLLSIVDVRAFRELAFAMAVGILLETFVVRPLLVPALLSLFGELSGWPGGRLARGASVAADGD
jgi:putative drug exporter of the RND superfamily